MTMWPGLTAQQKETRRRMCHSLGLALPIDQDALDRALRDSILMPLARMNGLASDRLREDVASLRAVIVARYHQERTSHV